MHSDDAGRRPRFSAAAFVLSQAVGLSLLVAGAMLAFRQRRFHWMTGSRDYEIEYPFTLFAVLAISAAIAFAATWLLGRWRGCYPGVGVALGAWGVCALLVLVFVPLPFDIYARASDRHDTVRAETTMLEQFALVVRRDSVDNRLFARTERRRVERVYNPQPRDPATQMFTSYECLSGIRWQIGRVGLDHGFHLPAGDEARDRHLREQCRRIDPAAALSPLVHPVPPPA